MIIISIAHKIWLVKCAYKGEKYIRCADCGTLVKDNHNHTKRYCNNCAVENRKEYKKTKQREYRMKSVDTIDGKRTP